MSEEERLEMLLTRLLAEIDDHRANSNFAQRAANRRLWQLADQTRSALSTPAEEQE